MKMIGFILLSLMCTSYTAQASPAEGWKKHDQNLKAACIKVSQLKNTKVVSDIMSFDGRVGYSPVVRGALSSSPYEKSAWTRIMSMAAI